MKAGELAERDKSDIAAVFLTREGRRFFARLLHECGLYAASLNLAASERTHETAFREGARGVGLAVLRWLQGADENAVMKIFEADKERKVDE